MHVVVIGGGWSGIAAAMYAAERGACVTVLESRSYLGGRARSFVDRHTGTEIDNGQHVLIGAYTSMLDMISALGTEHVLQPQPALKVPFVDVSGRRTVLNAGRLPGTLGMAWGIATLGGLSWSSKRGILRWALQLQLGRLQAGEETCLQHLQRMGQTPQAIERFWEPIILATLNAPLHLADAQLLLAVMRLGFLGGTDAARILLPTTGLSWLLEPFPAWLEQRNGTVRLSTMVERLEADDHIVQAVWCSNGERIEADAVVIATPAASVQRILPEAKVPSFDNSPIISVYLWYNQSWLADDMVATLGTTIQWVFRKPSPGVVSLTISAASALASRSSEEIITQCDAELRQLFGLATDVYLHHGQVIKEKQATPLFLPTERAARCHQVPGVPRNVAVAGDWTDTGLPATLEGAVRSGRRAAAAVIAAE